MTDTPRHHPVPRRASTIAMWLFLGSLSMLFVASLFGYVLVRVYRSSQTAGALHLPSSLWVSTLMMLAASYTMHRGLNAIRREKQALFRTYLSATVLFASVFVIIQTPAMIKLWHEHQTATKAYFAAQAALPAAKPDPTINTDEVIAGQNSAPIYGIVVILILVHALHVIGGMVSLGLISYNTYHGRYDHEHYAGVQNCVLYWHFLDAVWILMFTVIGAFG